MNKIKERRDKKAVCPKCKSPDYTYCGRVNADCTDDGKHEFSCNSCGYHWQYGKTNSKYTELI